MNYVDKISKLLRKAEGASTSDEADAFFAKAQGLMVKYAISEQELSDSRGEDIDEIIEDTYDFTGGFRKTLFYLGSNVARINGLKTLVQADVQVGVQANGNRQMATRLYLVGFSKDVRTIKLLVTSLELQVMSELHKWWKEHKSEYHEYYHTRDDRWNARHTFINGFTNEVGTRLHTARRLAVDEVVEDRISKTVSTDEASDSVALVLRTRKERVDEWYNMKYGRLSRARGMGGHKYGGDAAQSAGHSAGSRADIGQGRVGSNRSQLEG